MWLIMTDGISELFFAHAIAIGEDEEPGDDRRDIVH
jgi:hypothetical protein